MTLGRLIPIILLICACSSPDPPRRLHATFTVDNEFTEQEYGWIVDSGQAWENATDGRAELSFIRGATDLSDYRSLTVSLEADLPDGDSVLGECTGSNGSTIAIRSSVRNSEPLFKSVVVHELGHYLGLRHLQEGCIMYWHTTEPNLTWLTVPQQCDIDAFNEHWKDWDGTE